MSAAPRVVILSDEFGWHGRVLEQALVARGAVVEVASATRLMVHLEGVVRATACHTPFVAHSSRAGPGIGDLTQDTLPDAVFVRGIPGGTLEQVCLRMECLHRLAEMGVAIVNPPRAVEITVNKAMTSMRLAGAGIPMPATFCGESLANAQAFAAPIFKTGGKVVFKPLFGSQGEGLLLLQNDAELRALPNPSGVYYLQAFVPPVGETYRDWRLFSIEGEVVAAMERRSAHWITNRAQGGACITLPLTESLRELVARAHAVIDADYLGVDVLPSAEGPLMTEVNSIPAWQGLQRTTAFDVAGALADLVMRRIQHGPSGARRG